MGKLVRLFGKIRISQAKYFFIWRNMALIIFTGNLWKEAFGLEEILFLNPFMNEFKIEIIFGISIKYYKLFNCFYIYKKIEI